MTKDEINIAIAKDQGWEENGIWGNFWISPNNIKYKKEENPTPFHDYHGDLNAIQEVALGLDDDELGAFCGFLVGDSSWFMAVNATAPQRCEAYLKAKGLWK